LAERRLRGRTSVGGADLAKRRPDAHLSGMADDLRPALLARCPICGAPAAPASRPFCSARCADVDLQRWLSGVYVIPAPEDEERDPEPERA
jgi:uncharacterized protein